MIGSPAARRRITLGVLALASLFVGTGCGSYTSISSRTRDLIVRRDYRAALAELDGAGGADALLVHLERGLLLHYAGDYEASNVAFQAAEDLADELYTRSVTNEALALVTTDAVRPYRGGAHELVMVHVYRALNYVALERRDDALVEARKANAFLDLVTEDAEDPAYRDDAFAQYLTGILYEWGGETNDAIVSYRDALAVYEADRARGGPAPPRSLLVAFRRAADALGFADEARALAARYPGAAPEPLADGEGEVLVVLELGFVPRLRESRADVPIFRSDPEGREHATATAQRARGRVRHDGRQYHGEEKIAYWLSIALPVLEETPAPYRRVSFAGPRGAEPFELVQDLGLAATLAYRDREGSILLRTIARAVLKYLSKKKADDAGGAALGWAVNILGAVTERADVRSWRSLPHDVLLLRTRLPEGEHELVFETRDGRGRLLETVRLEGVRVRAADLTWVSYRLF